MLKRKEFLLHGLMCAAGGFAGCYSLLRCHDNFGAAQTANLISALRVLIGGDPLQFLVRLCGLLCYMAGIESYVIVSHKTCWDPQKWALATQLGCLLLIGLLPSGIDPFLCLYPIFYMMAVQWSVFHGACGYTASTIFSSNNVKQFSLAFGEYLFEHKKAQAEKAAFFGLTLVCYHIGVAVSVLCYQILNHYSVLFCCIPVLASAGIVCCHPRLSPHDTGNEQHGTLIRSRIV